MHLLRRCVFAWSLAGLLAGLVHAQVTLNGDAVVYFGAAANTSAPASIDETKVKEATTEWQTIQAEGVRPGSARYRLLAAEMDKRIREAVKNVAAGASKDLVVRSGDVANAQGKEIVDLTDKVIAKL
ncbi:MAG: hypothetical protein IPK26_27450 [Planctomycetes bacterium]|nr:hypothetical protein [Planctomycetota bacterium]